MTAGCDASFDVARIWEVARCGDLRGASESTRKLLASHELEPAARGELLLVRAFCLMRQGHYADAARELSAAHDCASDLGELFAARVDAWRAELAYFQGRYADASEIISRILPRFEQARNLAHVAFVLRTRIAILLARAAYDAIATVADYALRTAEASADDYVLVQILNILGAVHFDRATSKLDETHARAHLTALDPNDATPLVADAEQALRLFERARSVAERAGYEFAAWYVAGNIERLEILLGNAAGAVPAIRKRLAILQARGAKYDEIVTRSNLAWGLRVLGRYSDALHELDVALRQARDTGTFNVLLEFLEYDRSVVLDALGETTAARASYRRYLQLVGAGNRKGRDSDDGGPPSSNKRPLEPHLLKRADRYIQERLGESFGVWQLAEHCGVSLRTLEKVFVTFRGLTPVAHVRNVRLDHARKVLEDTGATVAAVAARYGFRSSTTFANEYRKRFGVSPRRSRRERLA